MYQNFSKIHEKLLYLPSCSLLSKTNVELIIQQLLIVRPHIDSYRQALQKKKGEILYKIGTLEASNLVPNFPRVTNGYNVNKVNEQGLETLILKKMLTDEGRRPPSAVYKANFPTGIPIP